MKYKNIKNCLDRLKEIEEKIDILRKGICEENIKRVLGVHSHNIGFVVYETIDWN